MVCKYGGRMKKARIFLLFYFVFVRSGVTLHLPGRMEDREESEPTIRNDKLTRPLIISLVGSSLAYLHYGYMFNLITHPVVLRMQMLNLQKKGIEEDPVRLKFLLLLISFFPLGGVCGVYLWGCLADRYGRKSAILISNGISIFSSAILCFDRIFRRFEFSLFVHFFVGIGTGTFNYSVSLYILEISSLNLRGALVATLLLFLSWGSLLVQTLISPQIWGNEENFSLLVGVIAIFAIISSILLVPSPESPRFLYLQRNDEEKARQVLKKLRGEEDVEEEMEELCQEHLAESSQKNMTVWKLLRFRSLRWHVITVVVLITGSRFMQTNAILIFAQQSYKTLGMSAKAIRLLPLAGNMIVQLMLLTTICIVESLGRRVLLLSGFLMCSISNIALVFTFQVNSPSLAFISIVLIIFFFVGYVMGPASIIPVIIGELFLQSSRASAYVIVGFFGWGINFLSALLFLLTKSYLETYYLLLYWPFMILAFIYIFRVVPETCGNTFQEIQESMAACTSRNSRKITAE
ncbi:solute carrier family 2, facilitated glucose transporter member 5-like [Pituophis catenifer annectens]|uniref:solute carrier family 2, facilitated glucose transporter member 5-like n=1 Tax=Pituophis catenifer annectens TaxID=94852 RepID=UPI0039940112